MERDTLFISELAEKSGVSVRTIRYYIEEGLLPAPQVRGRYSMYDDEYLQRIRLIKRLKESYLPLKEIKRQLESLTPEQITALLEKEDTRELPKPTPPQEASQPARRAASEDTASALDYITQVLGAHPLNRPEPPAAAQPGGVTPEPSRPVKRSSLPVEEPLKADQEPVWKRVDLAPGVELHLRYPLPEGVAERVQKLLDMARSLF